MVWVVTGGTKGLGRSLAMALVNEGHTVVAMGRDSAALAELHDGERVHHGWRRGPPRCRQGLSFLLLTAS